MLPFSYRPPWKPWYVAETPICVNGVATNEGLPPDCVGFGAGGEISAALDPPPQAVSHAAQMPTARMPIFGARM